MGNGGQSMGLIHHYGQDIRGHMAARGSAMTHKQWQRQRIGERHLRSSGRGRGLVRASVLANPSRAQLELTGNHFRSRF